MAVDDTLTDQLLRLLTDARGREHPDVDFKLELRIESAGEKAELAKDVAAQANLPSGGNLVYGADNNGQPVGLLTEPDLDKVANILNGRLQFAPPGIDCRRVRVPIEAEGRLPVVLWIRIPPTPYAVGTCFLSTDGQWKMPIRIDASTKLLSAGEAVALQLQRGRDTQIPIAARLRELTFESEPDSSPETLDSNLLPIIQLPETVWTAKTDCDSEAEVSRLCGIRLPPFRLMKGRLYTLRPDHEASRAYADAISSPPNTRSLPALLKDKDSRRLVLGLFNSEVLRFAVRKGLVLDEEGGRVYFPPDDGGSRVVSWRAFSRSGTRTVVGFHYQADKKTVDHWYHFAVSLRVQDLESRLALLVNPSWFFTYDGIEPLRSFEIASAATPRMNREDNARILYNTNFWIQFLSNSEKHIEIPLGGGPLLVSTETFKLRVPFGIAADRIIVPSAPPEDIDIPPEIAWVDVEEVEDTQPEGMDRWT